MKQKKSISKYPYAQNINDSMSHQTQIADMREQLRHAIEQLQQHKLSGELQSQKRMLIEHQYNQLKAENDDMRNQFEHLKRELNKLSKKYSKIREQRNCQKCKADQQHKENIEKQRDTFLKERTVLKNQIKELKKGIEMLENRDRSDEPRLIRVLEETRKELDFKNKTVEEQRKVIRFLDDKLSGFERQKLQTLEYIDELDLKMQQLQMENNILKGHNNNQKKQGYSPHRNQKYVRQGSSPWRKTGSIKNLQRLDKSRYSRQG